MKPRAVAMLLAFLFLCLAWIGVACEPRPWAHLLRLAGALAGLLLCGGYLAGYGVALGRSAGGERVRRQRLGVPRRPGARRIPLALLLVLPSLARAEPAPAWDSPEQLARLCAAGRDWACAPVVWAWWWIGLLTLAAPAALVALVGYVRLCSGGTWLIRGVEIGRSVVEGETWIAARPEFERTTWHRWLVGAVWSALRER